MGSAGRCLSSVNVLLEDVLNADQRKRRMKKRPTINLISDLLIGFFACFLFSAGLYSYMLYGSDDAVQTTLSLIPLVLGMMCVSYLGYKMHRTVLLLNYALDSHDWRVVDKEALRNKIAAVRHRGWVKWTRSIIDSEPDLSKERIKFWIDNHVDFEDLSDAVKQRHLDWSDELLDMINTVVEHSAKNHVEGDDQRILSNYKQKKGDAA